jgi:peroxiredoxin
MTQGRRNSCQAPAARERRAEQQQSWAVAGVNRRSCRAPRRNWRLESHGMTNPAFANLSEAFLYCRDMDASLNERLEAFSAATRYLIPGYQEAVDRMVGRLKAHDAGQAAPKPGEPMPPFAMPDETGHLVTLDLLLEQGPLAMTFHRGHWCPYCRINTRALAKAQGQATSDGGRLAAIMPERQQFAATFKTEGEGQFPVLTDIDNGYALSLNLAIWVGEEMQQVLEAGGRKVPDYQGNQTWVMPIPATFVIARSGLIAARFIDPDYRKRMAVEDLLAALKTARNTDNNHRKP